LAVVATSRADATIQASLVNAGVLAHPVSGQQVVGIVAGGSARKLGNLRVRPFATVVARSGWEWVAVEGAAELFGPDDPSRGLDREGIRQLLRDVFSAAGGTHDDWDSYDRVMAEERRTAVLIVPSRVYANG
jgi:PPOX class probable F420-dependent enzyme